MTAVAPADTATAARWLPVVRRTLAATRPDPIERRRLALAAMTRTHARITTGARP